MILIVITRGGVVVGQCLTHSYFSFSQHSSKLFLFMFVQHQCCDSLCLYLHHIAWELIQLIFDIVFILFIIILFMIMLSLLLRLYIYSPIQYDHRQEALNLLFNSYTGSYEICLSENRYFDIKKLSANSHGPPTLLASF